VVAGSSGFRTAVAVSGDGKMSWRRPTVFESQGSLRRLLPLLCEAAGSAPFGTMVGWHTPAGAVYGVVAGKSGNELLVLTTRR
jgi:hypothetical protein